MNFETKRAKTQNGNALIYIILALALLAALTMVIAQQGDQDNDDLSYETKEVLTTKVIAYTGSAKNVIDQMVMSGTNSANLVFSHPNSPSFDNAPYADKVFHPQGGGLSYQIADTSIFPATTVPASGWYINGETNIEWTPSSENDVMLVAYGISQSICENLNKKIKDDTTIPALTGTFKNILLSSEDGGGGDVLDTTSCAACDGYPALCVSDAGATIFAYYNIILAQ